MSRTRNELQLPYQRWASLLEELACAEAAGKRELRGAAGPVAERDAEMESLRTSLAVLRRSGARPAAAVTVTGDPAGGKPVNGNSHAM